MYCVYLFTALSLVFGTYLEIHRCLRGKRKDLKKRETGSVSELPAFAHLPCPLSSEHTVNLTKVPVLSQLSINTFLRVVAAYMMLKL